MSANTLTLSPIYDSSLSLTEEEGTCELDLRRNPDLVLELTPVIGSGAGGVSGPDIYAFAAAHG
jgi:hypothetical protein